MAMNVTAKRKVNICKASPFKYPELNLDVHLAGSHIDNQQFAEMFVQSRCVGVSDPLMADLVVFTGGPDVSPILYGEEKCSNTYVNINRDIRDIELFDICKANGIPMVGICRGAQFLHVMNGGKLYQHVNGHHGNHDIEDVVTKRIIRTSSVHHQMVRPNTSGGMEIIATCPIGQGATTRQINPTSCLPGALEDVEAFYYEDTMCIGFQGHPEYRGYDEYTAWCLNCIEDYVITYSTMILIDNVYRIPSGARAVRDEKHKKAGLVTPSKYLLKVPAKELN